MAKETKPKRKPNDAVLVKGCLIDVTLPSEGLVQIRGAEKLKAIDRQERVEFEYAPSEYTNEFKRRRRRLYCQILPKYAIKLQSIGGRSRKVVYLIPFNKLAPFLAEFDKDIAQPLLKLGKRINSWLKRSKRVGVIRDYVVEHKMKYSRDVPDAIPLWRFEATVDTFPIKFERAVFEEMLTKELKAEERKALAAHTAKMDVRLRDLTLAAVQELQGRLAEIFRKLAGVAASKWHTRALNTTERTLKNLEDLAESVGIKPQLKSILPDALRMVEIMKTKDEDQIRELVSHVAEGANVPVGRNIPKMLNELATTYGKTIPERQRAILRQRPINDNGNGAEATATP